MYTSYGRVFPKETFLKIRKDKKMQQETPLLRLEVFQTNTSTLAPKHQETLARFRQIKSIVIDSYGGNGPEFLVTKVMNFELH